MASVNKVILLGNLGADPETRYMPSGDAITTIRLATSERFKDRNGEQQERTEWHRVVFFGKLAEIAGEYLKKGRAVYVEGSLRTRKWQGQDGQDRYTTEVVASEMQMLGGRGGAGDQEEAQMEARRAPEGGARKGGAAPAGGGFDDLDDDIPF